MAAKLKLLSSIGLCNQCLKSLNYITKNTCEIPIWIPYDNDLINIFASPILATKWALLMFANNKYKNVRGNISIKPDNPVCRDAIEILKMYDFVPALMFS